MTPERFKWICRAIDRKHLSDREVKWLEDCERVFRVERRVVRGEWLEGIHRASLWREFDEPFRTDPEEAAWGFPV